MGIMPQCVSGCVATYICLSVRVISHQPPHSCNKGSLKNCLEAAPLSVFTLPPFIEVFSSVFKHKCLFEIIVPNRRKKNL